MERLIKIDSELEKICELVLEILLVPLLPEICYNFP